MRLSSITLSGFKTFARPTEIAFEAGVTAIVGPNGSGKSNIVDGFKWVLGESQARDLRGRRMDEVIYAGGERRARAAAAQVTIVFDNSDRALPLDYREVAIRRRLGRGGQSDYFLNGTRVRRRDLLELLASTGLTVDGYAMIGQPDIEAIISASPAERRVLIEEAARVRGVKQRRSEAAAQLQELALNLQRLEDIRLEIGPRLETVRAQAEAAREAEAAARRLELLRGSLVYEEWREARDTHRRVGSQAQSLQRRLAEARALAETAEQDFRRWRAELEAAQDRRLERQRSLAQLKLELATAEHDLELVAERTRSHRELGQAAEAEAAGVGLRLESAAALERQLRLELTAAREGLAKVPPAPPPPAAVDAGASERAARDAAREAETARRAAGAATSELDSLRARAEFLQEQLARLEPQVETAESALAPAESTLAAAEAAAEAAAQAADEARRLRSELQGLEALVPAELPGLRRLVEVLAPEPGWETALAAALGPLLEAWVAADGRSAAAAAAGGEGQRTVVYPHPAAPPVARSLLGHVRALPGYEQVAEQLLGPIAVADGARAAGVAEAAARVTREGVYHQPGLLRAGGDPRLELEGRRRELRRRLAELAPHAEQAPELRDLALAAAARVGELRSATAARPRLDETRSQLERTLSSAAELEGRLPGLELQAAAAVEHAAGLAEARSSADKLHAEHQAEVRRLELERLRWDERAQDLERRLATVVEDQVSLADLRRQRRERAQQAERNAATLEAQVPQKQQALAALTARLAAAEVASPDEEAELAAAARKLVQLEESRIDARLKVGNLQGNLELAERELELVSARMEEIRARMPEGLAPEEVPGGKAREREMRQLERLLEEIGPTNPLAASELLELEDRHRTLEEQLQDIGAARADLEQLIARLREEEETRYDAVFGAVAANFQELFGELSGGGRATLRHVPADGAGEPGVEILVQPPRKRLQNVTLLSSGERSLTAFALVMALEAVNPSPYVILDEVDAALDDANVGRFGTMLQRLGKERQLLVITHNHATMACAGTLYGIHLDESGCSHVVSVRLEEIRGRQIARSA